MYDQLRLKEIELQKANIETDRISMEKDHKRFCLEMARDFQVTNATELVSEAQLLYDFIK